MCGLFGVYLKSPTDKKALTSALYESIEDIAHRGPDEKGTYIEPNGRLGLAHVRLSIIDLANGQQPMATKNGRFIIVFNGQIYNYRALRKEIGGAFETNSDTEVVLRAYEKWGPSCVERFRGMFSIVIYDTQKKSLYLARDRAGIKPLYFWNARRGVFFASEIKAILPYMDEVAISKMGFSDFANFQFCQKDRTLFKDILQVEPGHYITVDHNNRMKKNKYWAIPNELCSEKNENNIYEELKSIVDETLELHLVSDVEVGSFVSGGLDSSILASLASDKTPEQLKAFNGRFSDHAGFDESNYAREVSLFKNLDLNILSMTDADFVKNINKIVWHLDHPVAGPGSFPQFLVSKLASRNLKVVLGGQGGDEVFGGYTRHFLAYMEFSMKAAIENNNKNSLGEVSFEQISANLGILKNYKPMLKKFWKQGVFEDETSRYWSLINRVDPANTPIEKTLLLVERQYEEFREDFNRFADGNGSYFDRMLHYDFNTLLPALLQVEDRVSMASGLESRVPFVDHKLVEFVFSIPTSIKFKHGNLKHLLKTAFSQSLPKSIVEREDKMGFPVPLNLWLERKGFVHNFVYDVFSSRRAAQREYLNSDLDIDDLLSSDGVYGRNIWALLTLEIWMQTFFDKHKRRRAI